MPNINEPVEITVLYFAGASTATGLTSERVALPAAAAAAANISDTEPNTTPSREGGFPLVSLADLLTSLHPHTQLKSILAGSKWAVDEEMVDEPETVYLKGGEEVAVICPVSGG